VVASQVPSLTSSEREQSRLAIRGNPQNRICKEIALQRPEAGNFDYLGAPNHPSRSTASEFFTDDSLSISLTPPLSSSPHEAMQTPLSPAADMPPDWLWAAMCHKRLPRLFDHLVGAAEHREREIDAQSPGRLEVDHQLELDWGLDGKFARLRTVENAIGIDSRTSKIIELVNSIGQQAADFSEESEWINGGDTIASR
jgi:hypothetical protein